MVGIGIDTGGTYTDAVIYDFEKKEVLSSGKSEKGRIYFPVHDSGHQCLRGGNRRTCEAGVHWCGGKDGPGILAELRASQAGRNLLFAKASDGLGGFCKGSADFFPGI